LPLASERLQALSSLVAPPSLLSPDSAAPYGSLARLARKHEPRLAVPDWPAADTAVVMEQRTELVDAFRALPRRQREVLALRYFLDLSVADTAATLRISEGTVRSTASRGLATLARILPSAQGRAES
jgi:RNA polymerase sigma factor (sigma-70 family)